MRRRSRLIVLFVPAAFAALLGGCGKKGPLYLPETPKAVIHVAAA